MRMKKSKSILTRKEAAELLSVSLTTLRTWTMQKKIQGYILGGRVYYKENELLKSLKPI